MLLFPSNLPNPPSFPASHARVPSFLMAPHLHLHSHYVRCVLASDGGSARLDSHESVVVVVVVECNECMYAVPSERVRPISERGDVSLGTRKTTELNDDRNNPKQHRQLSACSYATGAFS